MGTNYIAPIWRMPRNANKDKLSNYSIDFGTTAQYISTPSTWQTDVGLDNVKKLSFSVWVKPTATTGTSGYEAITSQAYGSWNGNFNITYRNDATVPTRLALEFRSVGGIFLNDNTTLTPDTWSHICFVIDLTLGGTLAQEVRCFVNNSEVANQGTATPPLNFLLQNTSFNIGRTLWGSGSSGYQWTGGIAQACFFDYTLSENQIGYLYNLNNPMAISGAEPVAYWPLGDNSNPNANAGYPNISVGADSVFDFNGSTNYIDLGTEPIVTGEFSISMWIKRSSTSVGDTIQTLIGKDNQSSARVFNIYFKNITGQISFWVSSTGTYSVAYRVDTSTVINDTNWHNIVFLNKGNGQLNEIYIDGAEANYAVQGQGRSTLFNTTAIKTSIGADALTGTTYNFNGEISNVQLWNTELSGPEITTLYNNGKPLITGTQPQEANLQAWYKLNQSANWDLFSQSKWTIPDSSSPYTKSFSLDSANSPADYFNTNIGPRGMTTNVGTYSCWINLNSIAGTQVFMDVAGFASREFLNLKIRNNNALQMEMRSWSTQMLWDTVSTTPFEVGKWYHVVAVGDGTNVKMYINGDEITTYIASGSYRWWSNFNTSIAHNGGNRIYLGAGVYPTRHSPLNGRISNAQIWNTNLSSSQIETLYNNGKPLQGTQPAQENLLAWYKLNQDSTWTNYNYWNNVIVNKWSSKNSAITTTPPTDSFGFSGSAQDGDYEGWEVTNKSISGSLLLSFWYKTTGDTVFTWTFDNDGSGNTNAGKARMQGNGYIYFFSPNASNYFYRANTNIGDYNWHNLIIYIPNGSPTYDANDINLWLDGVELGKPTIVGSTTWDAFTEIKGMNRNSSSANNGTGTQWSNWALFENVTPSDSVIDTIFNDGTPGDISSLNPSIWYKLNNTDTTFATTGSKATALSITDSSSNNNNATGPYDYDAAVNSRPVMISGDVQNAIAGYYMDGSELENFGVSALNGKSSGMNSTNLVQSNLTRTQPYSNYSFNFDGATNDYIDCTDADIFSFGDGTNDSPFSMSAWIKTTVGTGKGIISKWGSDGYEWIFWIVGPNKVRMNLNDNTNLVYQFRQGNTDVNTGEWVHAVVTYDGRGGNGTLSNTANQGIKIYINGVEESSYTDGNNPTGSGYVAMHNTVRRVQIAGYNSVGQFDGQISNAAIFDRVLNEDEILNIYNNGVPQDLQVTSTFSNNIVAWWPMDQRSSYFDGTDWIVRDLENGNDGDGANTNNVEDMFGNAPGSEASGTGSNLAIADLKGNMYNSDKNAYSINMADYADGVTNPANSGRSTDTP
jgi:hypothetical protein